MAPCVAMRADLLPQEACVTLTEPQFLVLRGALFNLLSAEDMAQIDAAAVVGPGLERREINDADEVGAAIRQNSVAVRASSDVAVIPRSWELQEVRFALYNTSDESGEAVATLEVLADNSTVQVSRNGVVEDVRPPAIALSSLEHIANGTMPSLSACLKTMPECEQGARALGEADRRVYELPHWVGETAIRFLSHQCRLQVLTRAASASAASWPLRLDNGGMLTCGQRATGHYTRLTFSLHASCATCLCGVHGDTPCDLPCKGVKIIFEYCGNFACCATHGAAAADARQTGLGKRVCTAARRLVVVCRHAGKDVMQQQKLVAHLPHDSSFLGSLGAACTELIHERIEPSTLRRVLCADLKYTVINNPLRTDDATLLACDELATSMLLEQTHYYGLTPRGKGKAALRRADGSIEDDHALKSAITHTHAHLLPSTPPASQ